MRHLTTALLIALLPLSAPAETPEEKGLAIIEEADQRDTGWVDATAEMKMILRNQQGEESERELRISSLEVENDGDKSLSVFDAPKDIKGTAFLSYTHALTPDDQWLYLPALKRVKRIASANKSGPFVGSEFAYEDLTSQEVEKYTYKYLRDEAVDGRDSFVIEAYPVYENSGYTRQVVWLDKEMYQPVKIDYYDRKNALLKTLEASEWQQYLDRYWRPGRMNMVNHQTGKSTELKWFDYQFKTGLSDRDFDRDTLKRTR
ncbi:MAG: outer membrane lipoprotein-sorting protein [Gammaproteobacteria bacterium]|nr:outer membrane lipoprotein-sorting protein [Planctomycetota bacterium]MCP5198667.1 outer membrane lipoprotein-sorting protein [Gammaproteobacteria bacterium]